MINDAKQMSDLSINFQNLNKLLIEIQLDAFAKKFESMVKNLILVVD